MHRPAVGVVAFLLLVLAGALSYFEIDNAGLVSALVRVGLIMAALWLALPEVARVNVWMLLSIAVGLFVFLKYVPPVGKVGLIVASPLLLLLFWPKIREFRARLRSDRAKQPVAKQPVTKS